MNTNVNTASSEVQGECRLCLLVRRLRRSHFMPAALYPKNKKLVFGTGTATYREFEQLVAPLLCGECEQLFNRNGEDEVLRWVAPKAKATNAPLLSKLRDTEPDRVYAEDVICHWAATLGINPERFAYFGLSLVWRAAANTWNRPDGQPAAAIDLGDYYEPVRRYLRGEAGFPDHTYVMFTVCTDDKPREYWMPPARSAEIEGMIVVPVMGLLFRFWFGPDPPGPVRRTVFYPSPTHPVFSGACWDVLSNVVEPLFPDTPNAS